jgi:SAM-dependent methyltransferase
MWSKRSSHSFDELYDISESDSEEVAIKLSTSVKKRVGNRTHKSRYPSIIIPSPGQWPTIDKLRSASALSPPLQVSLSPSLLNQLQQRSLRVPSTSSTPSLDGSLTSEELAASSCPSTPDLSAPADGDNAWEPPFQLNRSAINLLEQINGQDQPEQQDTVIEVSAVVMEMREVAESPPITSRFRIDTQSLAPRDPNEADDELSALSVPSPGGFFASLDSTMARKTWAGADAAPNTGTATEFYGVPFRSASALQTSTATSFYNVPWTAHSDEPIEHLVALASPASTQDPITARKVAFSPTEIDEVAEIDETYGETLKQTATVNIDRTQSWLSAQSSYMEAICEDDEVAASFQHIEDAVPRTPDQPSPSTIDISPSKKSVRFATEETASPVAMSVASTLAQRISPIHDGTFWEGWRHAKRSQRARDVFQHRQARAEAEQVRRVSLQKQHADQLLGKYEIISAERVSTARPVSSFLPTTAVDDAKVEIIARAERERQALQQMESSSWHVAAQKEVNGGRLLTSPIVQSFKSRHDVHILDLAGQAHCSWAWTVAYEHPNATVYTTVSSDAEAHVAESSLDGPANHVVVASPKLWELPFHTNTFDVVSARNLYTHLKLTWPKGAAADEWDLTLRECLRVLKPGGYLEFDLLDAELVHADAASQALGVEFAFNLKTRGYEPCSGKQFLPRLKRAGFCEIKRAWMVLPVADVVPKWNDTGKTAGKAAPMVELSIATDGTVSEFQPPLTGSTQDVRAMTGLVGARMWEQWMLKLNGEMGRSQKRVLDDVAKALKEAGEGQAGWKCLVGWARKEL